MIDSRPEGALRTSGRCVAHEAFVGDGLKGHDEDAAGAPRDPRARAAHPNPVRRNADLAAIPLYDL